MIPTKAACLLAVLCLSPLAPGQNLPENERFDELHVHLSRNGGLFPEPPVQVDHLHVRHPSLWLGHERYSIRNRGV